MSTATTRTLLYAVAIITGAAFSILFTGETFAEGSLRSDPGAALVMMVGAALVAALVGSAGGYRFILLLPATVLYILFSIYGFPPVTLEGWRDLFLEIGTDVYQGAGIMYLEPIPYDAQPGIFVLLIPVVMVVVAFAVSATLYEGAPILSVTVLGMTIGVLSTVSFEEGAGGYFAVFLALAVGLLLSTGVPARQDVDGPGRPAAVAGIAVVVVALFLPQIPLSEKILRPGIIDWTRIGVGGTPRLQTQADVGSYLTSGRGAELMRIESPEPLLWRAGTLDQFDGVSWSDTTEPGESYGEEIAVGIEKREVLQTVEVLDAETDEVFGGYRIISTSLISAQEGPDGSWSLPSNLDEGDDYRVLSEIPQPTAEQLEAAGTRYPADVRRKFLQLPEGRPEEIAETARIVRRDYKPDNPYQAARAVEEYLLYDGNFIYNLGADFRRADEAMERFLGDEREGFCTHFASAMALVLREQGIPTRMVYGAATGEEVETDEYLVTGADMHTWVEVYFPGVGWYPFDPTPGFTVPTAMEANAPRPQSISNAQGAFPLENPSVARRQQAGENPVNSLETPDSGDQTSRNQDQTPAWPLYVIAALILVSAAPVAKRVLLVRGRPEDFYRDLVGRLRDVLPPGRTALADSPALTPTERLVLLSAAVGLEEEPFREFAQLYSGYLYSANAGPETGRAVAEAHRGALRSFRGLPIWKKAVGAVNPSSLLARAGRYLSAVRAKLGKSLRGPFGRGSR